jgi:probable rRNA maturation factor
LTTKNPRISLLNRQRYARLDAAALRAFASELAERLEVTAGFSAVLISDRAIRKYYRQYAGKDRSTDVLSFPDSPGEDGPLAEPYLGDILISVETADRQRKDSLQNELKILLLHGLLHLLGYDHEVDRGEMVALEISLRSEFELQ